MKKWPQEKQVSLFIITLAVLFCFLSCLCFINGIEFKSPEFPERDFDWRVLFVETTELPDGWVLVSGPYSACEASPLGSGCKTYGEYVRYQDENTYCNAKETIYHYMSVSRAYRDFDRLADDEFRDSEHPWDTSIDFGFVSSCAEQIRIACQEDESLSRSTCKFVAQYDEFIVVFDIDRKYLDDEQLVDIFGAVDGRIMSYLD